MTNESVHIVGVISTYVWDVIETIERLGASPVCVDNFGGTDTALPNFAVESDIADRSVPFAVGSGAVAGRMGIARRAHEAGWSNPIALVDPTATVSSTVALGHGSYVNAGVVIGAKATIGCFANINRASSIGHHTTIGTGVHVAPGVTLAGEITVGDGAFIGSGAVVLPYLTIGTGAVVGAGAVVTKDVPAGDVVVGSPARHLKDSVEEVYSCPYCATS